MSDEDGRLGGLIGAGQRVVEHAGGKGERVEAIRHTLDLAARRFIAVAWLVLVVPILVGPWVLVVYVPLLFERGVDAARDWLGYEGETSRESMLALGALVLLALLLLPDAALSWWPWRWQIGRETWHWLRMPTAWLLVRAVLVIGPLAAWQKAVSHLDNRQIIEVEMPPGSSPASESIQLHNVVIPGWNNPHRNPDDEAEPGPTTGDLVIRFVPETEAPGAQIISRDAVTGEPTAARGGNGNGHRSAEMVVPLSLIARRGEHRDDTIRRAEALAVGMLADGKASRSALTGYGLTGTAAREMQAWLVDRGYAHDTGDGAGYIVTATGRRWLAIARRHLRLVDVAG